MPRNFSTRLKDNYSAKAIFSNLWLKSFVIASVLFVFCWISFGMYFEDNEAIVAAINYGVLGTVSNEQFFSNYHAFLLPVLYKLSMMLPEVPVYGIFKMSFVILINTVLIRIGLSEITMLPQSVRIYATVVLILLCFILVSDSQLHLHCIRHSIMLSFAALLLNYQSVKLYGKTSLTAVAIFFIAVNTRSHSSAIMLACFGLFLLLSGMPFTKVIKHYWVMAFIAFAFLAVYHVYGKLTNNMGKYIEAHYEYALIEKPSLYPLSDMKTSKDSAKYEAVKQFFLSDSIQLTIPFFNRVANINYEQTPIFVKEKWLFAFDELKRQSIQVLPMLSLFAIIALLCLYQPIRKNSSKKAVSILFSAMLVLLSLLLILVNDMKPRFFSSFSAMILFSILMFQLPLFFKISSRRSQIGLFALLAIVSYYQFLHLFNQSKIELEKEVKTKIAMEELHQITTKQPVLMFMGSEIPFSGNPFYASSPKLYPKLASFDGGYLVYFSYGRNRFMDVFGVSPVNFPQIINVLKTRSDVVYYIDKSRMDVINNYFKTIYHTQFEFSPLLPPPNLDYNAKFYRAKLISV
jgi:hypothetical protein